MDTAIYLATYAEYLTSIYITLYFVNSIILYNLIKLHNTVYFQVSLTMFLDFVTWPPFTEMYDAPIVILLFIDVGQKNATINKYKNQPVE